MGTSTAMLLVLASVAETIGPPPVTRVVLYPDSAIVTRTVDLRCDTGPATFANLPPGFDPDSLRAGTNRPDALVEGVSLREAILDRPYSNEIDDLQRQLEALNARRVALNRQVERAESDRKRAGALLSSAAPFINREAAMQANPATATWAAALDVASASTLAAADLKLAAEAELRDVRRHQDALLQQIAQLSAGATRRTYEADVVVRCEGRAKVDLSYSTPLAHWTPAYEARADQDGGEIDMTVLADVVQRTGESWNDVDVTLSTALARRNAQPPKLQRLYVDATPKEDTKKVLVRRDESASHLDTLAGEGAQEKNEAASDQGVSVQLSVPGKAEIPGDGRPSRLVVERMRLPATFKLITVPKLLPYVLTRGEARNAARYPLLPGPVSLFSKGSYLGTTRLQRIGEGDTIKLAFGMDESIQVRRSTLTEEKTEPGLCASTRRLRYGYRIELVSSSSAPVSLDVQEQIPVSEMDDVKVVVDPETTSGFSTIATDGLVTWPVRLVPGEKKLVDLHFTVEMPTKYDSAGL